MLVVCFVFMCKLLEFEKKVLTALESLKVAVEHNSRALQQIINTSSAVSDVHELSSDVTLPVKSIRELQLLDDKLEDDENFGKALVNTVLYQFLHETWLVHLKHHVIFSSH